MLTSMTLAAWVGDSSLPFVHPEDLEAVTLCLYELTSSQQNGLRKTFHAQHSCCTSSSKALLPSTYSRVR